MSYSTYNEKYPKRSNATYWSDIRMLIPESATMGNRQYPRTLTVTPMETPETAIKFSIA